MRLRILAIVFLLMTIGGGSFLIGRLLFAGGSAVEAQLTANDPCAPQPESVPIPIGAPPSTPRAAPPGQATPSQCLPPTIQALNDQFVAEAAKPKFVGVLNGFTFYGLDFDVAGLLRLKSPKCTGLNGREATETEGRASALNFTPTYLPPGTGKPNIFVNACQEDVITIGLDYVVGQGIMTIYRTAAPPYFDAAFPADRLQASTIGTRPAVIAVPLSPPSKPFYTIFMRDDRSLWIIQGQGIPQAELIKVAEGVR